LELRLEGFQSRLDELARKIELLTRAVAEGIEHVDRSERRVRATVARARRELAESDHVSPGLEAEWHDLRDFDGEGSETVGVPPVRENVARDPSRPVALGDAFPGAWTEGDVPFLTGEA
jgi:hypothetical protein